MKGVRGRYEGSKRMEREKMDGQRYFIRFMIPFFFVEYNLSILTL